MQVMFYEGYLSVSNKIEDIFYTFRQMKYIEWGMFNPDVIR